MTFESAGCKALLLEVMRRAAADWVLYRTSSKASQKQSAEEAYFWIFVEEPGTALYSNRAINKMELTAFVSICDVFNLDPDVVRAYIRRLTVKDILSTGRPPTYRRNNKTPSKKAAETHNLISEIDAWCSEMHMESVDVPPRRAPSKPKRSKPPVLSITTVHVRRRVHLSSLRQAFDRAARTVELMKKLATR